MYTVYKHSFKIDDFRKYRRAVKGKLLGIFFSFCKWRHLSPEKSTKCLFFVVTKFSEPTICMNGNFLNNL